MRVGLTPCRHPKPRGSPERPLRLLRAKATPSSVFSITSGTTGSPWVGTPSSVCLPRDFVHSCPSGLKINHLDSKSSFIPDRSSCLA